MFTFTLITSPSFLQYKHLFVHIGPSNPGYNDPVLESIDVRQIYDKFSEKKGGLKELYEKGPHNAFFLVKFWVSTQNQCSHWFFFFFDCYRWDQSNPILVSGSDPDVLHLPDIGHMSPIHLLIQIPQFDVFIAPGDNIW